MVRVKQSKPFLAFLIFPILTAAILAGCTPSAPSATSPESNLAGAQQTLLDYLALLHEKKYEQAAQYTADDPDFWQGLRDNNPSVDPNDRAGLLKNACELQGVCLEVRSLVSAQQVTEDEFLFAVEFSNPDGTLFVRGPCCGGNATDFPPESQFSFRVMKVDGAFVIYGGPIYVP